MSTYNIGQVSELFDLPVSTLRFYDKEGLFPRMERKGGVRKFGTNELEALRLIECLKKSGLGIKDIRQYMAWYAQGKETFASRKRLLFRQREELEAKIAAMQKSLAMIKYKCWLYEASEPRLGEDAAEDDIHAELRGRMPPEIQVLYDTAHRDD